MGTLTLPSSGPVYVDTQFIIYTIEQHLVYWSILRPLWEESRAGRLRIVTSELTLLEVLVAPLKANNSALVAAYEYALQSGEIELVPVSTGILKEAARLRATVGLKTPDAIHAATALSSGCTVITGNDKGFRRLAAPQVLILDDFVAP